MNYFIKNAYFFSGRWYSTLYIQMSGVKMNRFRRQLSDYQNNRHYSTLAVAISWTKQSNNGLLFELWLSVSSQNKQTNWVADEPKNEKQRNESVVDAQCWQYSTQRTMQKSNLFLPR